MGISRCSLLYESDKCFRSMFYTDFMMERRHLSKYFEKNTSPIRLDYCFYSGGFMIHLKSNINIVFFSNYFLPTTLQLSKFINFMMTF